MWDLYAEYAANLTQAGVKDFNDLVILAADLLRSEAVEMPCGGVVVDEVQDLTMVGLQFLHALAGDGPDRLLVIGDGQQSVYPGGFTLAEAGVDVRGRSTVLEVNYRNTAEILDAATRVISGDQFDDLEDKPEDGERRVEVRRRGQIPVVTEFASVGDAERGTISMVNELTEAGLRPGDIAVLCLGRTDADRYVEVLRKARVAAVNLLDYDGTSGQAVKVGTVKRAKGLEFAHVLLPEMRRDSPPRWPGESDDSYGERISRNRREVFVAMTRARDGLWLGYLRG